MYDINVPQYIITAFTHFLFWNKIIFIYVKFKQIIILKRSRKNFPMVAGHKAIKTMIRLHF